MSLWSWLFVLALAAAVPWLSARSGRIAARADVSRASLYASASASLWTLAALGYLVVRLDGQTLGDVYLRRAPAGLSSREVLAWTGGLLIGGLAIFAASHLLRYLAALPAEEPLLRKLRPTSRAEAVWVGLVVSPSAGVCEEFLYRGVLLSRLAVLSGSPVAGGAAAAVLFGAAHLYQGWLGAARAALIALLLAVPPLLLGTLLPSIAAHALIDLVGILWLWPLLDRAWPLAAGHAR